MFTLKITDLAIIKHVYIYTKKFETYIKLDLSFRYN